MSAMDRILGQARAVDVLQTQLAGDRLHHAYVFSGPTGVGKCTTALAFARLLLCHAPQRDLTGRLTACETCEACRLIPAQPNDRAESEQAGPTDQVDDAVPAALTTAHPDLHMVTKELARFSDDKTIRDRKQTQIPVEVLREHLLDPVQRAPRLGHGKVFIIDEAEMLNPTGQNLLLKTLEEPPAGTTLVLVTASEDRLLPTIRSRCHRIAFVPLPDDTVRQWLDEHASELIERDRQWLMEFASGSLGRAQLALDYELTAWAETVLPAMDQMAKGAPTGTLGQQIAECIDGFARQWVDDHPGASKEAANKLAADLMGAMIAARARSRMRSLAEQCPAGDIDTGETQLTPWLGVIDAVERMRQLLATNVNVSLVCDHLVTSLTQRLAPNRAGASG